MPPALSPPRLLIVRRAVARLGSDGLLLLFLFVATDVAVIGMAVAFEAGWAQDWNFRLATERGYAEVVQYLKEYWIALCFAGLAWRSRSPVYLVLTAAFTYILLDDAAEIHERGGIVLERVLGLQPALGLRAQDLGEVLVFAIVGALLLLGGAVAYRFSDMRSRSVARFIVVAVLVLAFFGIGMDMVHQILAETRLAFLVEVVEDGGELFVMSVVAAAVFVFLRRNYSARPLSR